MTICAICLASRRIVQGVVRVGCRSHCWACYMSSIVFLDSHRRREQVRYAAEVAAAIEGG